MRAGELSSRVTFQSNTPTANDMNEYVDTWTDYVTVWGADRPLSGKRYFDAKQANVDVTGEVEIRYRDDITADMRMVINSRTLNIITIIPSTTSLRIMYKEVIG